MENDIPITDGWLYEYELLILNCPLCGLIHRHGNEGYRKGDVTNRLSHCMGIRKKIQINIKGELTREEYNRVILYHDAKRIYTKREAYFPYEEN